MPQDAETSQPRGTRALAKRILAALELVPPIHRKLVFHHAVAEVQTILIAQSEKAKVTARHAAPNPPAKQAAATAAIRQAAEPLQALTPRRHPARRSVTTQK
jgi:hypothetical protein